MPRQTDIYRGKQDRESQSTWGWYQDQHGIFPMNLVQRKQIILVDQPLRFMRRLKQSLNTRLEIGTSDWEGDKTHKKPCCFLERLTPEQMRKKRVVISCRIDAHNTYSMNICVASLLMNGDLTEEQKNGLIYRGWIVSHRCGNWRCITPEHIVVESKTASCARKNCFEDGRCHGVPHRPRCLIGMKKEISQRTGSVFQRLFRNAGAVLQRSAEEERRRDRIARGCLLKDEDDDDY